MKESLWMIPAKEFEGIIMLVTIIQDVIGPISVRFARGLHGDKRGERA